MTVKHASQSRKRTGSSHFRKPCNKPLRLEQLEERRVLAATISIDDVSVTEGGALDVFVSKESGGLQRTSGIVHGPDGNLYVGETSNANRVLRYDGETGAFLDEFISSGSGGLAAPQGMVFGADGNFYVGSNENDSVLRYDGTTGAFIDQFVTAGSGGLDRAGSVLFGPDGNGDTVADLYVTGEDSDGLFRYDGVTGAPLPGPLGSPGTAEFVPPGSGGLDGPTRMAFGPDGRIYVASPHTDEILRYDETTGAFIDAFVASGSGGLDNPRGIAFGSDGLLYLSSAQNNTVLRYDGTTGAFLDSVASGASGLDFPRDLTFDASGSLLISNSGVLAAASGEVLRYSQAAFTVTLSEPAATEVTVDFSTADGTATAGADYTAANGTIVFEPGVTQRAIIVPMIDDPDFEPAETFFVDLTNPTGGATIADAQGQATIEASTASEPNWFELTEVAEPLDFEPDDRVSGVGLDGDTLVSSNRHDDTAATDSGAVFVYERNDLGTPGNPVDDLWDLQQTLRPDDLQAGDWFGDSVAIDGD